MRLLFCACQSDCADYDLGSAAMTTVDAGIQVQSGIDFTKMVLHLTSHLAWLHMLTSILREQHRL